MPILIFRNLKATVTRRLSVNFQIRLNFFASYLDEFLFGARRTHVTLDPEYIERLDFPLFEYERCRSRKSCHTIFYSTLVCRRIFLNIEKIVSQKHSLTQYQMAL